jgi:tripartite-type tricarboxylate transporter receptor subunit TctC
MNPKPLATLVFALLPAWGQTQPTDNRPIHIVIPFAPGGAQDVVGRYLGNKLAARLGVPVVVENKAGAGGVIAAEAVAKSSPDGRTLLLASGGAISIAPHLNPKLPYDPKKDFAPVALVADTPMTLAVRSASPYQTVADVLRDAKAKPGQVSYASTGNGTVTHLTGELFAQTAGVQLLHVPYRGAAPAMTDLLGGQVAMIVTSTASIDPLVDDKKARVLGTFTANRMANMKGAPTVVDSTGHKDLAIPVWMGLLAPAHTPTATIERLSNEFVAVCRLPETQERVQGLGAVPMCGGAKDLEKVLAEDTQRWAQVIRRGGIKAD